MMHFDIKGNDVEAAVSHAVARGAEVARPARQQGAETVHASTGDRSTEEVLGFARRPSPRSDVCQPPNRWLAYITCSGCRKS